MPLYKIKYEMVIDFDTYETVDRVKVVEADDIEEASGIGYDLADKGYYKVYASVRNYSGVGTHWERREI